MLFIKELVDLILKCTIDELKSMKFPYEYRFGLEVESKGVKYEFILHLTGDSDKLLVLGAGLIQESKIEFFKNRPVFSRISWPFDQSTIYYNDPTRNIDNVELKGGWGLGTMDNWYLEEIAKIIEIIARNIYGHEKDEDNFKNVMFYGSSMGGFMALQLSVLVKNSISIAEIPQFDIRGSLNWPPLEKQLFTGLSKKDIQEKFSYRINFIDLMNKEKYIPKAYIILDCTSKWDMKSQYNDFFDRLNELPYTENNDKNKITIRFDGKNQGHKQLDYTELYKAIDKVSVLMDYGYNDKDSKIIKQHYYYGRLNLQQQKLLMKYVRGRIDIINYGNHSSIEIIETSDKSMSKRKSTWIKKEVGSGYIINSTRGILDLKIKCINDGLLKIFLRGPLIKDKNSEVYPVYIDYVNFTLNRSKIFDEGHLVWHNKPFRYKQEVKNGDVIKIHLEWLPFNENSKIIK